MKISKFVFILIALVLSASFVLAQTKSKKPKKPVRIVSSIPTPTPTEPVIISRAEDWPLDSSAAISPNVESAVRIANAEAASAGPTIAELTERINKLEAMKKDDYDQKQKRLSMNLDILTKAEQRAESLRRQSFEMIEKENTIRTKLDQIERDLRPESIDRSIGFAGSLRPEELRAARKKSLEVERTNLQNLLTEVQRTKTSIDLNVQKADQLVERLRSKLEAEIDAALSDEPKKPESDF